MVEDGKEGGCDGIMGWGMVRVRWWKMRRGEDVVGYWDGGK